MASEAPKPPAPPYTAFQTFRGLLDRLHESGVPQRIDRSFWGRFLGGSVGLQIMAALRFLDLVTTEGAPTETLEPLIDPATRKATLARLIEAQYAEALRMADPQRATHGQLTTAFRTAYKIEGETLRKAVTFFIHAAKEAELPLSSFIANASKSTGASTKSSTRSNGRHAKSSSTAAPNSKSRQQSTTSSDGPPLHSHEATQRKVSLNGGVALTLSITGNLLTLNRNDRDFVFALIDQIERYEARSSSTASDGSADDMTADEVPF